jgi:hypothetical protein
MMRPRPAGNSEHGVSRRLREKDVVLMSMIAGDGRLGLNAVRVRMRARLAVALLLLLGSAGGLLAVGMSSASAQPPPSLARGRALLAGAGGQLYGIRCTSAASCWAVGNTSDDRTEALHWNGHQWSQVTTPNPGDYNDNLFDVACTSATDCWAVGTAAYSNFTSPNMALHWNGHTWSLVPTPSPYTGEGFNRLLSVTCVSPGDCWAVGDDSVSGQALHWNGHTWSLVATPGAGLSGVRCISSANCWAVGQGLGNAVLHWDGRTWATVAAPVPGTASVLSSIGCTSAANCWAVGGYGAGRIDRSEALRWDGHQWSQAATPSPRGSVGDPRGLGGVACISAADCWAVGPDFFPLGSTVNEAVHWNGHTWSYVTMPSPAQGENPGLQAIACTSSANCWAVGFDARGDQVLHWNGHHWSMA